MLKTIAISSVIAIAATQATAQQRHNYDLSLLPPDVAAHVVQLQQYGDRFEAAIQAIFAEHAKPCSNFDSKTDRENIS